MRCVHWEVHGYTIASYGNGLAYCVIRESDLAEYFLQGGDANNWRMEYDAADKADTLKAFLDQAMLDYAESFV